MRTGAFFILLLFTLPLTAEGQKAAFRASVDSVRITGFYRIPLSPELTQTLDPDREKLRLRSNGKEIPFILRKEKIRKKTPSFQEIQPIEKKQKGDRTTLRIRRPEEKEIRTLVCYTERPDSILHSEIAGRDEKDTDPEIIATKGLRSAVKDTVSSEFHIPSPFSSGHKFYRLSFRRSSGKPPRIIAIGYYPEQEEGEPGFIELPPPELHQREGKEKSYIVVRLDTPRAVHRMKLRLDGPPFFRRNCVVGVLTEEEPEGPPFSYNPIGGSTLSDTLVTVKDLKAQKSERFLLIIGKGPNPPLRVRKIALFQRKLSLIAHLKKGRSYTLFLGGELKEAPKYELANYRERIPNTFPLLATGDPEPLAKGGSPSQRSLYWIWASVIVAILVLGGFTYRMVNGMSKKKEGP